MKIIRFVVPFLFVRNWYDGSWELSRARMIIFFALAVLVVLSVVIAHMLQTPVVYTRTI
jgi:hypothetical protein